MKQFSQVSLVLVVFILCNNLLLYGQIAGQVPLDPVLIPQFVDPLPHFAGQRVDASGGNLVIGYEVTHQIALSTGTPLETGKVGETPGAGLAKFWAYSVSNGTVSKPALWPAFTIEAKRGIPVNVLYENKLDGETYASINLVGDQTIHWADPLMEMNPTLMDPYTGPIPVVPHLHGAEVPSESDGGPEAWFTPGYAITGPSWGIDGTDQHYYYPNAQEGTTLWYHDHGLGVTRLNVFAGLAGFYLLRDQTEDLLKLPGWSGDDLVKEVAPENASGVFNPNPYLPEIELMLQDRMFDTNGQLYFPNDPTNPEIHPFWTPEFVGDVITVNGKTWPYLSVAPRKYRFRLVNASNARFFELQLVGGGGKDGRNGRGERPAPDIIQIGTDGGFLSFPVNISARYGKLLIAPGERADIVIDFSRTYVGQKFTLLNSANAPYPDGDPIVPATTGRVMQFVVNGEMVSAANPEKDGTDKSRLPGNLRSAPLVKLTNFAGATKVTPAVKRQLTLNEVMGMGGPIEVLVNNSKWDSNGMMTPGHGETELPTEGTTELWQIINTTADAHPLHLHLVQFQLVSRQAYNTTRFTEVYESSFSSGAFQPASGPPFAYNTPNDDGAVGGNPAINKYLEGRLKPANLNERGWKDTQIVYPGEVTTFIIRFAPIDKPLDASPADLMYGFNPALGPGYVWHCHILDHEDNEMMRVYTVTASPYRTDASPLLANAAVKNGAASSQNGLAFSLDQNFPNPGTNETEIRFQVPEAMHVRLALYNQLGQMVKILIDNNAPAGNNRVILNREGLPNGIYFYKLSAGKNILTKKMILH